MPCQTLLPRRHVLQALVAAACPGMGMTQDSDKTGVLRWVPLGDVGGLAMIDAQASGPDGAVDGAWLLDTGAEVSVVHTGTASRLGLRHHGSRDVVTPGGRGVARLVAAPLRVCGEGSCLDLQEAAVLDLGAHAAAMGESVLGIIGWSALLASTWALDPTVGRWRRGGPSFESPADARKMILRSEPGLPIVEGLLNECWTSPLLLDTGFAGALMLWGATAATIDSAAGASASIAVDGIGGRATVKAVLLARLRIGTATWTDVPALLLNASPFGSASSLRGVTGAVGMSLFENSVLGFDAGKRYAWTMADVDTTFPGGFGVVLTTRGSQLVAQQVLAGSPAARAAVLAGDELVALDGNLLPRPVPPAAWGVLRGRAVADFEWRRGDNRRATTLSRERFFARVG